MVLTTSQLNELVAVVGVGGLATAAITQVLKKGGIKAGVFKKDGDAIFHWLALLVTALVTAAGYLIAYHSHIPKKVLGVSGTGVLGVATFVYKNSGYAKNFLSKINVSFDKSVSEASTAETTPPATPGFS